MQLSKAFTLKRKANTRKKTAVYQASSVESAENAEVRVGWVEIDGHTWKGKTPDAAVLGISSDYELCYALGFLRDRRTNVIRPVLITVSKDGSKDYYIIGDENQVMPSGNATTSSDHKKEIEKILREAQKLSFVEKPPTENRVTWVGNGING